MSDAQYIKQLEEQNEKLIKDNDRLRQENANLISGIIINKIKDDSKKQQMRDYINYPGGELLKYQTKMIPMTPTIMKSSV